MTTIEERRRAEFPQYERPAYYGIMRPWRVALFTEWLAPLAKRQDVHSYLDVGCGPAETLDIAKAMRLNTRRGCDVVQSVCNREDVDLIPGVHDLSIYQDDQFDVTSCNDVLEHVLEEDIPAALSELSRVTKHAVLLGICRKPGTFHICIQTEAWWMDKIHDNMEGDTVILYEDRIPEIKQPYLWVEIRC